MYAKKDDILQYILKTTTGKDQYSFALCPKSIYHYDQTIDLMINRNIENRLDICRDFHRFNLVLACDNDIRVKVILANQYRSVYKNRPYSTLFGYCEVMEVDDIPF